MAEPYNPMNKPQSEAWHLDKKVPVAIIFTLLVQLMGIIWWAARLDARDTDQERRISNIEVWQSGTQQQLQKLNENVARMDERLGLQIELLKEIKGNLGRSRR